MSVISEKNRKALFAKSNVPALVGEGLLTGIFESKAPNGQALPYGIIQRQAPGRVDYAFGSPAPTQVMETDLYVLKILADIDSVPTELEKEPQEFAEDMLALWAATIGNTLTVSGHRVAWMVREADMPPYEEPSQSDRYIYHRGFFLRIKSV